MFNFLLLLESWIKFLLFRYLFSSLCNCAMILYPKLQERLGNMKEGIEFLELCGFERVDGGKFLFLPRDKVDLEVLKSAGAALDTAITNPFFGLLSK